VTFTTKFRKLPDEAVVVALNVILVLLTNVVLLTGRFVPFSVIVTVAPDSNPVPLIVQVVNVL
jgi:hypothetical protein